MWPEILQFNGSSEENTSSQTASASGFLVFIRFSLSSQFFFFLPSVTQLGILVNNGAVTHTRCLSTKQAPTVPDLLRMISVFRTGLANGVHFHYHKTSQAQETNCLLGLIWRLFRHMLDLTAQSVYGFINSSPRHEIWAFTHVSASK